jgi:hypothetical protein
MLLQKIKSNHTLNFILFPLLGVLFWLRDLIYPTAYPFFPGEESNLLYGPVQNLLARSLFLQQLAALLLFLFIAFLILQINNRYNFIHVRTMIPATLFVILAGGFNEIHVLHPVYFGAIFFLIALYRLLSAYDLSQPYSAAFDSGFFLGISTLFYLNIIVVLPAFMVGIGLLSRETKWNEFVVMIVGFILPLIFGTAYAFYMDNLAELLGIFYSNIFTINNFFSESLVMQIYAGFLILLTLLGSVKMIKDYDTKKVSTRKFFIIFFLIFLSSIAAVIFFPAVSQEMLLITIVPVTFLISNLFVSLKSRFWGETFFLLLILIVFSMQIFS